MRALEFADSKLSSSEDMRPLQRMSDASMLENKHLKLVIPPHDHQSDVSSVPPGNLPVIIASTGIGADARARFAS